MIKIKMLIWEQYHMIIQFNIQFKINLREAQ